MFGTFVTLNVKTRTGLQPAVMLGRRPMSRLTEALRRLPMIFTVLISTIGLAQTVHAQQTVDVRTGEIGGVVTSAKGSEAGVWVIAETTELPTKFARIVVTDDQGRYLIPDLPAATYSVWVRGYGLVD